VRLTCLLIAGAIAAPASAQQSAIGSAERVRAGLEKPAPRLTLADRKPDFSVHIEERHPLHEVFESPPWALPHVGWTPPAVGFDLLSVVRYVAKGVAAAKRGHDEHLARDEVQLAITDYCAAQPDGGAAIQLCSTSPAIR
jgi:hypothetical protein